MFVYRAQRAAQSLRELTNEFLEEESNPLVTVGKKMSEQMSQMAEFTRGKGDLRSKTDMILTAKAVATNGQTIHRIADLLSRQCPDERSRSNLLCCAEMIPTLSTQLTILASVKTATPDDLSVSPPTVAREDERERGLICRDDVWCRLR